MMAPTSPKFKINMRKLQCTAKISEGTPANSTNINAVSRRAKFYHSNERISSKTIRKIPIISCENYETVIKSNEQLNEKSNSNFRRKTIKQIVSGLNNETNLNLTSKQTRHFSKENFMLNSSFTGVRKSTKSFIRLTSPKPNFGKPNESYKFEYKGKNIIFATQTQKNYEIVDQEKYKHIKTPKPDQNIISAYKTSYNFIPSKHRKSGGKNIRVNSPKSPAKL